MRTERPTPGEGKYRMNLGTFKSFSADRMDIDELVALMAFGKALRSEYDALQMEEPAFVDLQFKSLRREITARTADKLEARKRELTARIDSLKTPAQKKQELEKELANLEKQLSAA
ncbi:unnamed protein product [Sphagnum jensenii]